MMAWLCSLILSSVPQPGAAPACTPRLTVGPTSERHRAQDLLFENRVDPTRGGIRDGGQIHPGARLHDGADHPHKEVGLALSGRPQAGSGGMSDKRHGWSP